MLLRALIVGLLAAGAASGQEDWKVLGSAVGDGVLAGRWTLEGSELVGRAEGETAAWWRAPGEYWDFDLELEFFTPAPCDGGVQVRSHWLPLERGNEAAVADSLPHAVYGYQANIETREADGTGAILDRGGRGRLVSPSIDSQERVKPRDWNRLRVLAEGGSMTVWVNGVISATLFDEAFLGGFVALQVAPLEDGKQGEIRYRNIRIRDLGRTGRWRALFDGRTLEGWHNWGSERWTVADGTIHGRRGPKSSEGYLATDETWRDFRVRGRFMMLGEGNYGLFYHSRIRLRDDGYPVISGVQGEVMPGRPAETGRLYESYRRGWITSRDRSELGAWALREDAWNAIEIRSVGNRVTTWVNGIRVVDMFDETPQVFEGSFALQLHTGEGAGIDWKDLYVED